MESSGQKLAPKVGQNGQQKLRSSIQWGALIRIF